MTLYAPRAAVRLQPIHALRLACGDRRTLLPVVVSAENIHDVRDRRQTSDRRQTKASLNAPPIRAGHNNVLMCIVQSEVWSWRRSDKTVSSSLRSGAWCVPRSGGSGVFFFFFGGGGRWVGDTFIWGHTTNTFALN